MVRDLFNWIKKYSTENLLGVCIILVITLSLMAGTIAAYIIGALLVAAFVYFIFQLQKAAQLRLQRLRELDKSNREQLLDNNTPFNPDNVIVDITNNLRYATEFVREIGKGNFNVRLQGITDENFERNKANLAGELISMKVTMKASAEEEKKRVWATEGLANFGELLRTSSHDLAKLTEEVVIFIVKYLKANQGGIFILNDDNEHNKFLELKSAYAFERKKYLTKQVAIGEGLVGQAFLERETIHLREVPKNYVTITSGLGGATPQTLILVPLKIEETVVGILEIASFKNFEKHEIEFCEKIGESIASTISGVKVNERTRILLDQSQQQAEEMRAQEEEMRQNMEELQATQESVERGARESQDKEAYLKSIIDSSTDAMMTIDKSYRVVVLNKFIYETFKKQGVELRPGMDVFSFTKGDYATTKERYDRAFDGETVVITESYFGKHYQITTTPVFSQEGEIMGACIFTKDITNDILLKTKADELLNVETRKTQEILTNRKLLIALTRHEAVQNGDLDKALEVITETLANRFAITRAAVWTYDASNRSIQLAKLFEKDKRQYSSGMSLYQKDIPRYFDSIENEEVIVAPDANNHAAIAEFKVGYLDVLDIKSMLDVPFFIDGNVGGVICCENQGQHKHWTPEEEDFAKSVADIITIAYKSARMKEALAQTRSEYESRLAEVSVSGNSSSFPGLESVERDLLTHLEAIKIARQARS